MEREKRYIYNPFILNFLNQKVIHLDRIKRIIGHEEEAEQERICRENLEAEQLVEDVSHLLRLMRQEKYKFDIHFCNYEYILFRMCHLFRPSDKKFCQHAGEVEGDLFFCELKLFDLLSLQRSQEEEKKKKLFDIVARYIKKYYIQHAIDYQNVAVKRASLLFDIKHKCEEKNRPRSKDKDYSFQYDRDVITTMMYLFFINEFIGMVTDEQCLLRLQGSNGDDDTTLVLLESLRLLLVKQYDQELKGFVIVATPSGGGDEEMRPYTTPIVMDTQKVYFTLKNREHGVFTMKRVAIDHLCYLLLCKNAHFYINATRRFIFDYHLGLMHDDYCPRKTQQQVDCQLCRYFSQDAELQAFYASSVQYAYTTCHYIVPNAPQLANRQKMTAFLETFMFDLIDALDSVIYKNARQLLVLARARKQDLFRVINIGEMINFVRLQFPILQGGYACRLTLIMKQIRNNFKINQRLKKWHQKLALDTDILFIIMYAINAQQNEIEKYHRNVSENFSVTHHTSSLQQTLTEIYQLYLETLRNAMIT